MKSIASKRENKKYAHCQKCVLILQEFVRTTNEIEANGKKVLLHILERTFRRRSNRNNLFARENFLTAKNYRDRSREKKKFSP